MKNHEYRIINKNAVEWSFVSQSPFHLLCKYATLVKLKMNDELFKEIVFNVKGIRAAVEIFNALAPWEYRIERIYDKGEVYTGELIYDEGCENNVE